MTNIENTVGVHAAAEEFCNWCRKIDSTSQNGQATLATTGLSNSLVDTLALRLKGTAYEDMPLKINNEADETKKPLNVYVILLNPLQESTSSIFTEKFAGTAHIKTAIIEQSYRPELGTPEIHITIDTTRHRITFAELIAAGSNLIHTIIRAIDHTLQPNTVVLFLTHTLKQSDETTIPGLPDIDSSSNTKTYIVFESMHFKFHTVQAISPNL